MLLIHPGYPKTGTTFLQQLVRDCDWYFGAEKADALSTQLSAAARKADRAEDLPDIVRRIGGRARKGQTILLSEEALLSLRPYENAYQTGLYRRISERTNHAGCWHEPVHKLLQVSDAVRETRRAWLLTIRRHPRWCRSYYRYTLSELGPARAAVYLTDLLEARAVGGPLYAPTVRLIRALDPAAPLFVLPMEIITDPAYQAQGTRFFADRFGLHVPLASGVPVNASAPPLPAAYTRFVRGMTHTRISGPLRRAGRLAERLLRARVAAGARDDSAEFDARIDRLAEAFRQDTAVLQEYSPFDLKAFGYGA